MEKTELEKEREKLSDTIEIIRDILEDEKFDLSNLFDDFIGDREELWRIADRKKLHISNLETAINKPYFARIDFTSKEDGKTSTIYIGKNGIMKNAEVVVTDWRAPISSLYYTSEIGECSFEIPDGEIKGNMSLKRQFEIESGKLVEFFDLDLVTNDGLLRKYLDSNNDTRLKSIVSTIQKEQNDVIRRKISNNIIIQGVAGSGKTTVALHRIAYLVYNYMKNIKDNQYLVIGPNPVFLKYIQSVLPELDVDGVEQCTYESFAQNYIEEKFKINPSNKKVVENITKKRTTNIDKFKCSMQYKEMLEKFMKLYISSITSKPLLLGDFEVLSTDIIKDNFKISGNGYTSNLNSRIEATIDRLVKYIKNEEENIFEKYNEFTHELFKNAKSEEDRKKMKDMFIRDRNEISKSCRNLLRKYFNKSKISTIKLYKLFVSTISDYDIYHFDNLNELKKDTLKNIKNESFDFEDLAALIYIKSLIDPNKDYTKIRHVVIDEAQDLGEFNFYTLKTTMPSATFSIFGDLAQSIYDYRGIDNWNEVNNAMFNNNGDVINFNKSYRTTAEIMNVADGIAESIGLERSDTVIRHGEKVKISEIDQEVNIPKAIAQRIIEYKEKGYKTIAIISKTDFISNYINKQLSNLGINIPNITIDDDLNDEKYNICTISNQLAKGLEFDAVIINNVNEINYSSDNSLDMKLLYVAVTRALHKLDIIYTGTLTKTLQKQAENEKTEKSHCI